MRQRFSATRPSFSAERLSCFVVFGNSRRPRDCDFLVYRLSPYPVKVIDHLKNAQPPGQALYYSKPLSPLALVAHHRSTCDSVVHPLIRWAGTKELTTQINVRPIITIQVVHAMALKRRELR